MTAPRKPARWRSLLDNMPRLLHLVWEAAPLWLTLNWLVTLVAALLPAAQLYVTKLAIDGVVALAARNASASQISQLVAVVGAGFGLALLQNAFEQLATYLGQVVGDRFALHANAVLLQQAIRLDLAHFESSEFYDVMNRAQQSGSAYPLRALNAITQVVGRMAGLGGLLLLLLRFSPPVVVLLLATSLPSLWVGVDFSGRRFWMLRHQTPSRRLADYFGDILTEGSYVKEVRLFGLGDYLLDRYCTIRDRFNQESEALTRRQSLARFAIGMLSNVGFYGAYGLAIAQTLRGELTVGDLTLVAGAFPQAQNALQGILAGMASIYEYNLYVGQFFEFLRLEARIVSPPGALPFPTPLREGLVLRDVTFAYPGASEPVLQEITLSVAPGECVALVGANGSGKTTLLKLLARFYDPDRGEITVDGIPLRSLDLVALRANVGVLFQDFARYALSVEDNVGFGNLAERHNRDRVVRAVAEAGADRLVADLAQGYDTVLGKLFAGGVELSGGQWQKIGLARAFMSAAQILILDEPTAAVDAIAEHELFQRFRELTRAKMTFLVSHRFSTVRMADRIVVLEKGRIIEQGSHRDLMTKGGPYSHMFTLQAAGYRR